MLSVYDDIVKSPSDDRVYHGFQLSNKLKVVVISDPNTDKAAASMDVQIGTLVIWYIYFITYKNTKVLLDFIILYFLNKFFII